MARSILIALAVASMLGCSLSGDEVQLRWEQSFSLSEAGSSRMFEIKAPDPRTHTFVVRVDQPLSAAVALRIETWNDTTLRVFDSTAEQEADGCEALRRRRICVAEFPALEAQPAGSWRVVVMKLSTAPAHVGVEIEFAPLSS